MKNITTKSDYKELYEKAELRFNRFLKWYDFSKGNLKILDFGCGCGWLLNYLSEKFPNNEYHGFDTFQEDIEYAKSKKKHSNVKFYHYDGKSKLPFKDEYFDFIVSNEVLEHVDNPKDYVKELSRVMKDGANGFFSTPNRLFPFEFHYNLPLINFLPSSLFNRFVKLYTYPYVVGLLDDFDIEVQKNILSNNFIKYFIPQKYIVRKRGKK